MTTTDTTPSRSTDQLVQDAADRGAIADLVHRLGILIDEQRFDQVPTIFAPDAAIATPGGRSQGVEAIAEQARRNHRPDVHSQHQATDVVVDLDGDRASIRANHLSTFVQAEQLVAPGERGHNPEPQFRIASVYRYEAVRTPEGWRLSSMEMHPLWETGERP
jgi:SnoaL-like protein